MKITAIYLGRKFQDSGSDGAPDYYVHVFSNIVDSNGKKYSEKWIKETRLTDAISFSKGSKYEITLSRKIYSDESSNMPFPIEITWADGRVYMKNGNSIIRVGKNGEEKNLSEPLFKRSGKENFALGFFNKFQKNTLTEEELLRMNERGIFYCIHYIDPQDKRMFSGQSYGQSREKNYVLIEQEEQNMELALKLIKSYCLKPELQKHFEIITKILGPKKRNKKK